MLSKYARVSIIGARQLSTTYWSRLQNVQDTNFLEHKLQTPYSNVRLMSNSLAQEILKSKQQEAEQKKTSNENQSNDDEGKNKGPKPLTKWQKIGFWAFGIFFTGTVISNGILFCKFSRNIRKNSNFS